MQKHRKNPETCGATFREWNAWERFFNQAVITVAWRTYYIGLLTVKLVALMLDCLEWVGVNIYIRIPMKAHDDKPQSEGWTVVKMRYGDHAREYLFYLKPTECVDARRTIVYVHGGGFVAANAGVLMHNLTAFCRQGFDIYCVNYDRSPFPAGIISMLKVLDFVRMKQGLNEVALLGDSAGGNLVLQAAACVTNPPLLTHVLEIANKSYLKEMQFPNIKVVASICGLLDRTAVLKKRLNTIYYIENLFMILMITFPIWMYESQIESMDYEDWGVNIPFSKISRLPLTRIIAGTKDPLIASSWKVYQRLQDIGIEAEFISYNGRHIFFGFPNWWLFGNWKIAGHPCLYDLCDLFNSHLGCNTI